MSAYFESEIYDLDCIQLPLDGENGPLSFFQSLQKDQSPAATKCGALIKTDNGWKVLLSAL